jgi:hypothetical protein
LGAVAAARAAAVGFLTEESSFWVSARYAWITLSGRYAVNPVSARAAAPRRVASRMASVVVRRFMVRASERSAIRNRNPPIRRRE